MTGAGINQIDIDLQDLLALSDETNDLFIDGDVGDKVLMYDIFSNSGQITVGDVTYDQWTIAGTDGVLNIDTDVNAAIE
jgi:hypothetical protein